MNLFNAFLISLVAVIANAIPQPRLIEAVMPGCERACADIYLPVCGFNNEEYKIFDNYCSMETVNCIQKFRHNTLFIEKSMNLCKKQIESAFSHVKENIDCNKACTLEYNPICAFNGRETKTYGNMCIFETANCELNYKLRIAGIGECSEIPQVNPVKKNCDRMCPATYIPVCGFDGRSYKTYANTCQFDIMNCESDNHLRMISMGECPQEKECAESYQNKNNCNKACTLEYNPICGFDGRETKTYGNMCIFEAANCESNYKLRIAGIGECSEIPQVNHVNKNCDRICPATYIPVCGFDGTRYKTYANTCQFDIMNCESDNHLRIISMGECPQEKESSESYQNKNNCNKACTLEYNPICGFDGRETKTYGNMCIFEAANCESNYKLRIAGIGECPEFPQVNHVKKDCDRICPTTYIPVCGFDGRSYKTYANTCQFDIMNCASDNYLRMISMGECPQEKESSESNQNKNNCNKACTLEYNPICGFDGRETKTYGNMCMFEAANCESNYKFRISGIGECNKVVEIPPVKEMKAKCIRPCPAIYLPVCGFDGESYHTYGSTCEFEMMNCDSDNHLRMIKSGEC